MRNRLRRGAWAQSLGLAALAASLLVAGGMWPAAGLSSVLAWDDASDSSASPAERPAVKKGQRVAVCGHSFHVFIAEPLAALADEAGLKGHQTQCVQFLGNSRPLWHWNVPDRQDRVKRVLRTGHVDVLTLAPHVEVPDEGIDRFADLAIRHNPKVQVFLQLSWAPFDGKSSLTFRPDDRDRVTKTELNPGFRTQRSAYVKRLREQAQAINGRHGKSFVWIVPVADAVDRLREEILAGNAPGLAKQSELFKDAQGHGTLPLKHLVTYCWFAAIYQRSPVGLTALETKEDEQSRELHRLLQALAWEAVTQEPASGVTAP